MLLLALLVSAPPPAAPPSTPVTQTVPPALADWTPRPATGPAEPWEKATDKDWVDGRFRDMDTGPFLNASFRLPAAGGQLVVKGTAVRLPGGGLVFDRNAARPATGWTGGYLSLSDRRFGLMNTPTPVGQTVFLARTEPTTDGAGVTKPLAAGSRRYRGLSLDRDGVVVHTSEGDSRFAVENGQVVVRSATVGPPVKRWGEPLVTPLVRGNESGPFAVDTLTLPYANRYKALWFCTALDFLPDGRLAVCTAHGDVWLATVDEAKGTVSWQRFATGLYQPMGLKVVDGKVVVLERGQLTRLHDTNGDGEADFYECLSGDWHGAGGEHSYDTCLETDPQGNFWFFKTGDTDTPHGGCLLRVGMAGGPAEVMATGFRHPIGLGMSPTGIVTGADQEGNYMPATRIDEYKRGGFYGDLRAHHRATPPTAYDGPLCWVPREVDNSAGGQVWVPPNTFGPLASKPLHLSYGRCKAFALLREETPAGTQGGVWDLGLSFLSGVKAGRFGPDGALYIAGLNGWQTAAKADGCVQRVRFTGKPLDVPTDLKVTSDGVALTFSRPLDRAAAEQVANYRAARWNYRWSKEYGSPRLRPSNGAIGQDDVPVTAARLSADGRTVRLTLAGMIPVMQLQVGLNVPASDGRPVVGSVYLTPRHVPAP